MLVRAYDDTDARMQEEVLKKTVSLAKQLDVQVIATSLYLFLLNFFLIKKIALFECKSVILLFHTWIARMAT